MPSASSMIRPGRKPCCWNRRRSFSTSSSLLKRWGRSRRRAPALVNKKGGAGVSKPPSLFFDQFLVAETVGAFAQDALCRVEQIGWHDALERAFLLDPHLRAVHDPHLL